MVFWGPRSARSRAWPCRFPVRETPKTLGKVILTTTATRAPLPGPQETHGPVSGLAYRQYEKRLLAEIQASEVPKHVAVIMDGNRRFAESLGLNPMDGHVYGREKLEEWAVALPGVWSGRRRREELVSRALTALHIFERDKHYLVSDGKIQIIDEYTGRVLADRSWELGLHQMIEVKEGCPLTDQQASLARMTYQRFFRRYLRISGMTGTAREIAGELWSVYRLPVVRVPTNRPVRRKNLGERVFATEREKWTAIARRVRELNQLGRPVLIGTRSVAASELLSALLTTHGVRHQLLNARQDKEEAEIVAQAGQAGRVTVATNMAGRGTDIVLARGVAERGGLHVIATELHESRRIDRQLFGRGGRQGDPGSFEAVVSAEDELLRRYLGPGARWTTRHRGIAGSAAGQRLLRLLLRAAQRRAEASHARIRKDLLRMDEQLGDMLAFSGRGE